MELKVSTWNHAERIASANVPPRTRLLKRGAGASVEATAPKSRHVESLSLSLYMEIEDIPNVLDMR